MSNLYNRVNKLEKQSNERPFNTPQVVEIWGTREDGTSYLIDTWKKFIETDDIFPREVWRSFIHEQPNQQS